VRSALALAVASLAAGLLNYLFQVHGAAVLDATAFGLLSAWLAQVTLASAITTVVQFVSLDAPLARARFDRLLRWTGVASLLVLAALVAYGRQTTPLALGVSTFVASALLYAVVGQLQARLRLADVAATFLATAGFRFALPFAWAAGVRAPSFYVAHAAAALAGVVAAAALVTLRPLATTEPATAAPLPERGRRLRLGRPVLLAFATVLFPFVDVLAISSTHDAATTGAFSRIALAARIVFFGGAAVLQILLAHHLHAAKSGDDLPAFVVRVERWATPALLVGAAVLAAGLDVAILHPSGGERVWLFASCLEAAVLVAILGHVQRLAAYGELARAVACVAGVVVTSAVAAGVAALGGAGSVSRYAVCALAGDLLVLLLSRSKQGNSRSRRAEVASRP
jgi:hypothetical protein